MEEKSRQNEKLADSLDFLARELEEFERVWDELNSSVAPIESSVCNLATLVSSKEQNTSTLAEDNGKSKTLQQQVESKGPPPPLPGQRPAPSRNS